MRFILLTLVAAMLAIPATTHAADKPAGLYELRIYTTEPGRLDALHARFRDHTTKLFAKHGITNVAYWDALEEKDGKGVKLYYLLAFPSKEAREKSWKEFGADPEWQKARADSEKDGPILIKKGVQSIFLAPTDYSPCNLTSSATPRVFSLRIYTTVEGKLDQLHDRFAKHTIALFEKHGMTNLLYTSPTEAKDGAGHNLTYFLAFPSREAHDKSFADFRADPEWVKVKAEYEKDGSLTVDKGVQDILLVPTDYSPLK